MRTHACREGLALVVGFNLEWILKAHASYNSTRTLWTTAVRIKEHNSLSQESGLATGIPIDLPTGIPTGPDGTLSDPTIAPRFEPVWAKRGPV